MTSPNWLSLAADVLSLIGFFITIWVLIATYALKQTFTLRARAPELRKALERNAKKMAPLLASWPSSKKETLELLADSRAVLENLSAKLPLGKRGNVDRLARLMQGRKTGVFARLHPYQYSESDLWSIYTDLVTIIAFLQQREKDATWE